MVCRGRDGVEAGMGWWQGWCGGRDGVEAGMV